MGRTVRALAASLLAVTLLGSCGDPAAVDAALIGVPPADASCGPVIAEPASGAGDHVTGRVDYPSVPPSSGPHRPAWVDVGDRAFYTTRDAPEVESLVHNLEHGYTVLWYDPLLDDPELDELRSLAEALRADSRYAKFVAAPWDLTRGELPDATPVALAHWGAEQGYRQFCGKVSGPAVTAFMDAHPASDSPEPAGP